MRFPMVLLLLLAASIPVAADTMDIVIGSFGKSAHAGSPIRLPIYFHNPGHQPLTIQPPQELAFQLTSQEETHEAVALIAGDGGPSSFKVAPQGYLKVHYALTLPKNVKGIIYLTAPEFKNTGRYLSVTDPSPDEDSRFAWLPRSTDQSLDSLVQLYQPYVKNISYYKPIYFLVGTEPEYSKFQLSLKYRFFNPEKPFVQEQPWLQGFHFGYTQTSFWDLDSDSAPFGDTSYKPELFYISQRLKTQWPTLDALFLKAGFRHESNGRGGELSRSTNTVYIEPILIFYDEKRRTGLKFTPSVWTFVDNDDETNPDLDRYRGYFNLGVAFGKADSFVVDTNFKWAAQGASLQVDVTYPLHTLFFNHLDMYIQAQYVNQLAESLINYTERTEAFRLGIAIVR